MLKWEPWDLKKHKFPSFNQFYWEQYNYQKPDIFAITSICFREDLYILTMVQKT
jgi:hypothetical protein